MRAIVLATPFLALLFLSACTRPQSSIKLVHADSLMQSSPDSALSFLQKINSKELVSPEDRAYYALLVTQARDKNYILQTDDSLILIAVQYYDSIKNIRMQAKAHYCLGCVLRDKRSYPEALKTFFEAITYARTCADYQLTGYIYNNIASLYLSQRLIEQADSIYQITEKLAIQESDSTLWADVLSQRGMINVNKGKAYYHEAEQKILRAFDISCNINQKGMIAKTAYSLSLLYGRMDMGEKAIEFAKLNIINQNNPNMLNRAYLVLGDAYYKTSRYDSASIYLNKSLSSNEEYTKAGAYMRLADIAKKQAKLEEALEMERKYSFYLDKAQQKQQSTAIVSAERNIIIQHKQSEYKANLSLIYYYIIAGIMIFIVILLLLWKRHKKEISNLQQKEIELNSKTEQQLLKKNEQIASMQKKMDLHIHKQNKKNDLDEEVHALETKRQIFLKETYEHSEVYVKMKRIIRSHKKTDKSSESFAEEDWKQLIAETDIRWDNITFRLATKYKLSQEDIHLCCLYLTDIPTSHFRYIMECSRDAIYKKSKKILEQKIDDNDKSTSLRDFLEQFLKKG